MAGIGEQKFVDGWYVGNDMMGWTKLRGLAPGETAGSGGNFSSWKNTMRAGEAQITNALSTAQQGVGVAGAGAGAMRGDAASMRQQANLVNTQGNAVNRDADALAALVPKLDPYAQKLGGYGDDLAALAQMYLGESKDAFGQARALALQDPNATGLAGEYLAQYSYLSPDRYVSRAASDAQSSIDNARAQNERNLARRGVSVGSGASAASSQLQAMKEAAVLAAAKTLGRQMGIDERGKWINQMTAAADTMYNWGLKQGEAARGALGAAGDAQKGAAGVIAQQGSMLGDAGKLRATAGQLFASAADIFGGAAKIEGGATDLELSALKSLESAQQSAAQYYLNAGAQGMRGGGGGGRVGVTSTPEAPDYWEQTGHSSSYWKNNLSDDDFAAMAQEAARYNMAARK